MIKSLNECYQDYLDTYSQDYDVMYFNDSVLTRKQLEKRVKEIECHLWNLGIRRGKGVGYSFTNCKDSIPVFFAIAQLGAYGVPLFSGMPITSKLNIFQKAEISVVLGNCHGVMELKKEAEKQGLSYKYAVIEKEAGEFYSINGVCKEVDKIPDCEETEGVLDLPLLIGSSSGTTGIPKMVCMTQKNVGSEVLAAIEMVEQEEGRKKVNIAFSLTTSVMLVICGYLLSGQTLIVSDDLSPMNFLKNTQKHECYEFSAPPAYYESLLLHKDSQNFDLSSVHGVSAGMDFCSVSLLRRLKSMFPNLSYYINGYGMVETSNIYFYTKVSLEDGEIEKGRTLTLAKNPENEIKVQDDAGQVVENGQTGELYVRGTNVVRGYMNNPWEVAEPFPDGWLRTGDIVRKENEKSITLLGRRKYFIKRGGRSVSPIVLQKQINETDGVVESGVVGVPHPLYGEMIWAFVVKEDGKEVSLKDIKKKCKVNLPYYMLPDQVTFVEKIPKRPGVGKVDFETLKKMAKEQLEKWGQLGENQA